MAEPSYFGLCERPRARQCAMLYTRATMMGIVHWKVGLGGALLLVAGILVVAIIVSEVMERRDRVTRVHSLNMVAGAFFGDLGNDLLRRLTAFDAAFTQPSGDVTCAYYLLARQWLGCMERLSEYPYLNSLTVRTSSVGSFGTAVVHA